MKPSPLRTRESMRSSSGCTCSSGQQYRTNFGVENATAAPGPNAHLRAAGIRRRFVATRAQLWVWLRFNTALTVADVVGSFAPCKGPPTQPNPPFEVYSNSGIFTTGLAQFPLGAEEYRIIGDDPAETIQEIGADATTVTRSYLAADLEEWTPIGFNSLFWKADDATGKTFQAEYR